MEQYLRNKQEVEMDMRKLCKTKDILDYIFIHLKKKKPKPLPVYMHNLVICYLELIISLWGITFLDNFFYWTLKTFITLMKLLRKYDFSLPDSINSIPFIFPFCSNISLKSLHRISFQHCWWSWGLISFSFF